MNARRWTYPASRFGRWLLSPEPTCCHWCRAHTDRIIARESTR